MFDLAAFSADRSGVSFSKLFNRLELFNRLWGKATPIAGAGALMGHSPKEQDWRITGWEIALCNGDAGCYQETEWMNYLEGGLLHLISCVSVMFFQIKLHKLSAFSCPMKGQWAGWEWSTSPQKLGKDKLEPFPCAILLFGALMPYRRGVTMKLAVNTKDLGTAKLHISSKWSFWSLGRRQSEMPHSKRKVKDILLLTTKKHLIANHFCN